MKQDVQELENKADPLHALTQAIKNIQISAISTYIKVPKFDPNRKTAEPYLVEIERYFQSLQHDPSNYLGLVGQILKPNYKTWFDHVSHSMKSWDDFKSEFKARFDGPHEQSERLRELVNRQQQLHESTERYIYEMAELSKYCYPNDNEDQHVRRVRDGLHPKLNLGLGATIYRTTAELIYACKEVTANICAQGKIDNESGTVPPMYEHECKGKKKQNRIEQPSHSRQSNTAEQPQVQNVSEEFEYYEEWADYEDYDEGQGTLCSVSESPLEWLCCF